jgi:hypothetical protein
MPSGGPGYAAASVGTAEGKPVGNSRGRSGPFVTAMALVSAMALGSAMAPPTLRLHHGRRHRHAVFTIALYSSRFGHLVALVHQKAL